jgi:hypothetical protein
MNRCFNNILMLLLILVAGTYEVGAQALQPQFWVTDGPVNAIARDNTTIYIGGSFTQVGPPIAHSVAINAGTGQPVAGFPSANGPVYATIPDGTGGWYIGGEFSAVGGLPRNRLAHIRSDNTVAPWNPGANSTVLALAFDGSVVYAGGFFDGVGGQQRNRLAAINGTTAAVTGWNPNPDGPVFSLAVVGTTVYVGGSFFFIGGQARGNIAAINAVGNATSFNPNANGTVRTMFSGNGVIYLGGDFTFLLDGQLPRLRLAAVDPLSGIPTDWNPRANAPVYSVALLGANVFFGGAFQDVNGQPRLRLAAADTAGNLTPWNPGANNDVYSIAISGTSVYAGGNFTNVGGQPRRHLAAISVSTGAPTAWNPMASRPVYVISSAGGNIFAGGDFGSIGGVVRLNIAALDATTGAATPWNSLADGEVNALVLTGGTLYAGGAFTFIGGQQRNRLAAISTTTGQATAWNPGADNQVGALALSGTTLYAGGRFTFAGGQARNNIAAISTATGAASAWNPNADNTVLDIELDGAIVYASGFFNTIGGQPRNHIAALDNTTGAATAWNPNANAPVNDMAISGGIMYAGGEFLVIGGQQRASLAALSLTTGAATTWNPSADGPVNTVRPVGPLVYVGGIFQTLGGQARSSLASVLASNGSVTPWNPMLSGGSGDFAEARAIVQHELSINVGGNFTGLADSPRFFFAGFIDSALAPVFQVSPTTLNYNNVLVGTPSTDSVVVTNNGVSTLQITSAVSTNTDFSVLPSAAPIPSGSSRAFVVTFIPSSPGPKSGSIRFEHNGSSSPDSITVNGTGVAPVFSVSPASISFGNVPVGGSKPDSVTVTNSGTSPLNISSVVSTQAEFSVIPANATIPASGTLRFYITLAPTSAGAKSGFVLFNHNAATVQDTVGVSGAGVTAGFNVIPSSLNFGSVPVDSSRLDSVMVTNGGGAVLTVNSVTSTHADYLVAPSGATIPPSSSATFRVTFRPTTTGLRLGNIVFVHTAPGSPDTAAVSGTGVVAGIGFTNRFVEFDVEVGTGMNQPLGIINTGAAMLRVDSLRIRPGSNDFSIVGSSGPLPPIAPGDTALILLRFAPRTEGAQFASLLAFSNAVNNPDSVLMQGLGIRPLVQVSIGGDTLVNGSANVTVTPPAGFQINKVSLLYRPGGAVAYDSLAMNQSGATYVGSVPPAALTLRGVEYYVRIDHIQGTLYFPSIDPEDNPAIVRTRFSSASAAGPFPPRRYTMVAVPADLVDTRASSVFEDDYGPYARNQWRLFRREGGVDVEHPNISSPVIPGTAFWLVTHAGQPFDIDNGRSVSSGIPAAVMVQPGWNQIANPFAFPIGWQSVAKGGRVKGVYRYDGVQYQLDSTMLLMPWEGYYVFNEEVFTVGLTFPPRETRGVLIPRPFAVQSGYELSIQLRSSDGNFSDLHNVIGFHPESASGTDHLDYPKPPAIGDYVSAAIVEGDREFMRNFRPLDGEGEFWDVRIQSSLPIRDVDLTLTGDPSLPQGYNVYVFDLSGGSTLGTGMGTWRLSGGAPRTLRIVIGTQKFAQDNSDGLPLTPLTFSLEQNYPNPFNPSTTVRYQLGKQGHTRLEIYNILGQRVRILVDEFQISGTYQVEWDGRDQAGAVVSSGVYLMRLQSGGYVNATKMLFLR